MRGFTLKNLPSNYYSDCVQAMNSLDVQELYEKYVKLSLTKEYPVEPLSGIILNVANGQRGDFSVEECVKGVLSNMVFNLEKTWEEKMELANATRSYTPEQQAAIDRIKGFDRDAS